MAISWETASGIAGILAAAGTRVASWFQLDKLLKPIRKDIGKMRDDIADNKASNKIILNNCLPTIEGKIDDIQEEVSGLKERDKTFNGRITKLEKKKKR